MTKRKPDQTEAQSGQKWSTVILYENAATRARALQSWLDLEKCHGPAEQPAVEWFSFAQLSQPVTARKAADKATVADYILFATSEDGDVPGEIKLWMESWLGKRCAREGAIVGLMEREQGVGATASLKEIYLRHVAHRVGMDYVSETPPTPANTLPDSLDSVRERAGRMTAVLDSILQTQAPPRYLGIG